MKGWFLMRVLAWIGQKMDGKKTYAGAAGKVLIGLAPLIAGLVGFLGIMFPDQGLPKMSVEEAIALVSGGFYAISSGVATAGVGHKIVKETRAIESTGSVQSGSQE